MFNEATFREILLPSWMLDHLPDLGRSISQNVALLNILAHDVINLLHCEHWTDKRKYLYVNEIFF